MILFLIGYRGSGKTTVAQLAARRLNWKFVDTDDLVERYSGKSIREIFTEEGEAAFRKIESNVVQNIDRSMQAVIALGGGAVLDGRTRQFIGGCGRCIWLRATTDTLLNRTEAGDDDPRPPLTTLDRRSEIQQMMAARESIYASCADYSIETDNLTPDETADAIARWVETVDK